jgi:hypothetical protein
MTHQVVARTFSGGVSVMKSGTRAECLTYVRRRSRQGLPTHFCYVISASHRAWRMFMKRAGL